MALILPPVPHGEIFEQMVAGAKNVLTNVLAVKPGEHVLVVIDDSKKRIGRAFSDGATALGASVNTYSLSSHDRPINEIPYELKAMLKDYSVIINTFYSDSKETPFRVKLLYEEISHSARVGHAPGITEDMMHKGPMNVDYRKVVEITEKVLKAFDKATLVHITTRAGTDLTMDVTGRDFETDVRINSGSFGNLPAGEIWCGPVEDSANGVLLVDGTIGDLGYVKKPLRITIKDGRIKGLESEDEAFASQVRELVTIDAMADVIGELGIGTNPGARLVGNMLEDEKAGGTAHIAFGNNMDMPGGQNNSDTHRDFLFHKPTFEITRSDGKKHVVMRDGVMTGQ
ncbi:MAG: aminopeptidase [Methanobacteriota archaeon]